MKYLRILLLSFFIFAVGDASAAGAGDAKAFVNDLGNHVLEIVKSGKSDSEKEQQLIQIFNENVNTDWMARFVLGRYSRTVPQDKLERYKKLYRDYVMNSYIPRFREYTSEKFRVSGVRNDKDTYIVQTEILRPNNQQAIKVDYRLVPEASSFKVIDIVVEGVSLINTQRSEFGSIISNNGFDTLLAKIEAKVKSGKVS